LVNVKKWLTPSENHELIAGVDQQLEADRDFAVASPMPQPETAAEGVYCDSSCHAVKFKYGVPRGSLKVSDRPKQIKGAVHLA
jgi:hypothetical protein